MKELSQDNPLKRLGCAFAGLLVGDAVLLLYHLAGKPARTITNTLQSFFIVAIFSLVGWLLVGVPTTLLYSARSVVRLAWPLVVLVGAGLGPLALVMILLIVGHGHIYFSSSFAETSKQFAYSILISVVSFAVYVALLRKEMHHAY